MVCLYSTIPFRNFKHEGCTGVCRGSTWWSGGILPHIFNLDTRWPVTHSGRCDPAVIPGAHLIRGRVGPRTSLDILEKRKSSSADGEPKHESSVAHTEAVLKIQVFRDVVPYRLVDSYRRFEGLTVPQSVRRNVP